MRKLTKRFNNEMVLTKEIFIGLVSQLNLPNDIYGLHGGYPNEAYVMENDNGSWKVYYSERGRRTGEQSFLCEEDALECLYNILVKETSK